MDLPVTVALTPEVFIEQLRKNRAFGFVSI